MNWIRTFLVDLDVRYVLSPTHLHEFKSADRIYTQPPVMSLYLADQKLGSHSQPGSSSHKFMIKGKQTGSMHRGHSWVFRAESYETMLAWYDDIKSLTEKSGEELNAFVRKHAHSFSSSSARAGSVSGESAMDEDEADAVPFSANGSLVHQGNSMPPFQRPSPGGRFPSDLSANQYLQRPISPSEGSSDDRDILAAAARLPQHYERTDVQQQQPASQTPTPVQAHRPDPFSESSTYPNTATTTGGPYPTTTTGPPPTVTPPATSQVPASHPSHLEAGHHYQRNHSNYGSWMAPAGGGAAVGAGVLGAEEYWRHKHQKAEEIEMQQERERQAELQNNSTIAPANPSISDSTGLIAGEAPTSPIVTNSEVPALVPASVGQEPSNISPLPTPDVAPIPPAVAEQVTPIPLTVIEPITPTPPAVTEQGSPITITVVEQTSPIPMPVPVQVPLTVLAEPVADLPTELTVPQPASAEISAAPTTAEANHTAYDTNPDGSVNATRTGTVFPILRHNTDTSVSNLHIPGEFPRGTGL